MDPIQYHDLEEHARQCHEREIEAADLECKLHKAKADVAELKVSVEMQKDIAMLQAIESGELTGKTAEIRAAQFTKYLREEDWYRDYTNATRMRADHVADLEHESAVAHADAGLCRRLFDAGLAFVRLAQPPTVQIVTAGELVGEPEPAPESAPVCQQCALDPSVCDIDPAVCAEHPPAPRETRPDLEPTEPDPTMAESRHIKEQHEAYCNIYKGHD